MAAHPGARGFLDDAAVLGDLVLTHDTIVEGVHYLPSDPPGSVGWKLAAVNLSDLAAKGATPLAALLSLALKEDEGWEAEFLSGYEEAALAFGMPLIGGDTVALPPGAPRVLGLTAIGRAGNAVPSRAGGRAGDRLWVIGDIGDAAAGLEMLKTKPEANGPLVNAYRRPTPLLAEGQALAAHVTAMMDVSDGFLLDASRLAAASGCGLRIDLSAIPLSTAFRAVHGHDRSARLFAATGGDDYALLASLPPTSDALTILKGTRVSIALVGELTGDGALVLADDLGPVPLPERLGYEHHLS